MTVIPQGESTQTAHGLQTEVPVVPDVPIGHFALTLYGAKQGYLANTQSLCAAPILTRIQYQAQNGKTLAQKVAIKTACGSKAKKHRKRHH